MKFYYAEIKPHKYFKYTPMKKDVFCDTMIWYYVADNKVKLEHDKFNYYGNTINISDFLTSDKNNDFYTEGDLKKAILAMHDNCKDVIMLDTYSVVAFELIGLNNFDNDYKQYKDGYNSLVGYAQGKYEKIISPGVKKLNDLKSEFQDGVLDIKRQLNIKFKEKSFDKKMMNEYIESNMAILLLNNLNTIFNTNIKFEDIKDWTPAIFFIKSFSQFILDLQKTKPEKNSMLDYLHLLFINLNGNKLIWTTEKKLLKKINKKFDLEIRRKVVYQDYLGKDYFKHNEI